MDCPPLGVMDSGIGGLSVLREIRRLLPQVDLLYVADQANLPYGPRSLAEVQGFSEGITRFLLEQGAGAIVIACNTASAAALHYLRQTFPTVPFVGLEPAVRPAARDTQHGKIAVIATEATFQGQLYASLIERYAENINVVTRACPELVTLAERGAPYTPDDYALVADSLRSIRESGADQLVLGCTHFTFLTPLIQAAIGESMRIIDPAPAVARQVERIAQEKNLLPNHQRQGRTVYMTTGHKARFVRQIKQLLAEDSAQVKALLWSGSRLLLPSSP